MHIFKTSRSRENILRKVRKETDGHPTVMPYPDAEKEPLSSIYTGEQKTDEESFAEAFINAGGKFVYCDNEQELLENIYALYENRGWKELLCTDERLLYLFVNNRMPIVKNMEESSDEAEACITGCEGLIARTGSILFSSRQHKGRTSTIFYPVHLVVAYANEVWGDLADGLEAVKKKYRDGMPSMINVNTGPSRTADIEKTLVTGVHGPGEVFCFFVNADK